MARKRRDPHTLPRSFPSWKRGFLRSLDAAFDKICIEYCPALAEVIAARIKFRSRIVTWIREHRLQYRSLAKTVLKLQNTSRTSDDIRRLRDAVIERDIIFNLLMKGPTELFAKLQVVIDRYMEHAKTGPCCPKPRLASVSTNTDIMYPSPVEEGPGRIAQRPGYVSDYEPDRISGRPGRIAQRPGDETDYEPDHGPERPGHTAQKPGGEPDHEPDRRPDRSPERPGRTAQRPDGEPDRRPDRGPERPGRTAQKPEGEPDHEPDRRPDRGPESSAKDESRYIERVETTCRFSNCVLRPNLMHHMQPRLKSVWCPPVTGLLRPVLSSHRSTLFSQNQLCVTVNVC